MRVHIKNLKGEQFVIEIQPSDCFLNLKNKIHESQGITVETQKIVYKGKVMDDKFIISQAGVKEQDNIVLMKTIPKKEKQISKGSESIVESKQKQTQKLNKIQENQGSLLQKNIEKLVKLGYDKKTAQQTLKRNDKSLQKSLQQLMSKNKQQGKQMSASEVLRQQIMKNLAGNQQLLALNENGELKFTGDLQSLASLLGPKNQQLQKILLQNPDALQQLLINDEQDFEGDQNEIQQQQQQEMQNQFQTEINFTPAEEQAIQRLMVLGFTREQVVPVYLACDKNQEQTANMLFNQQQNGDFIG